MTDNCWHALIIDGLLDEIDKMAVHSMYCPDERMLAIAREELWRLREAVAAKYRDNPAESAPGG